MTWEAHPAAELFPLFDDDRLAELAEDIEKNGLYEPVCLYVDELGFEVVLDGRNRLAACELAGIEPDVVYYDGDDPIGFVLSQNLHRRHLTAGQRAAIAANLVPLYAKEAEQRQQQGLKRGTEAPVSQNSGERDRSSWSATAAGEKVGVSHWSVETFQRVQREDPALAERVKAGEVTLNQALKVVKGEIEAPGKSRRPVEQRLEQIRDMAAQGYRADQIGDTIGVRGQYVRDLARKNGIALTDDQIGKTRRIDPNRIVGETAATLEGLASGVNLLNGEMADLDPEQIEGWATSLNESLKPLNRLRKQLKEMAHAQD